MMDLNSLRELPRARPIFVGGMARSGTTTAADILNCHPCVSIQPEISPTVVKHFIAFVRSVDEAYENLANKRGDNVDHCWRTNRAALLHSLLVFANKEKPELKPTPVGLIGVKTPGLEKFFRDLNELFSDALFVYCVRRPDAVWRSLKSMGWNWDLERFTTRYRRSLHLALGARRRYPDRFSVFYIDRYLAAEDRGAYISESLFSHLNVPLSLDVFSAVERLSNRNSAVARGRLLDPLENKERDMLLNDEVIRERWFDLVGSDTLGST